MSLSAEVVQKLVATARAKQRDVLLEHEGLQLMSSLGLQTPAHVVVTDAGAVPGLNLDRLPGARVVVKVLSAAILHKSDVGGVVFVDKNTAAIAAAVDDMQRRLGDKPLEGFLIAECVDYDKSLGGELLLGARYTPDFGPVVTFGPGGIYTEFLSKSLRPGRDVAVLSPTLSAQLGIDSALADKAMMPLIRGGLRGQQPRVSAAELEKVIKAFLQLAAQTMPHDIGEIEINPLVLAERGIVVLDVLCKLGTAVSATRAPRPVDKLKRLFEPKSIAIIGVSEKLNPGHIIVNNMLREGFPAECIHIIKPGLDSFKGCPCHVDVASMPEPVDLFVLAVAAAQVPEVISATLESRKAETMIIIPGGLGETEASKNIVAEIDAAIQSARSSEWRGPLLNGGNCLGIRSKPGRYDTMFIPEYKLPPTDGPLAPLAVISQSGALAVARASKFAGLNPKYIISIGNQIDLTVGDYLSYFKDDADIEVIACYVEGFRPGDGTAWLKAAAEITAQGRTVILYRAGRTAAGMQATASHTASVAGDYAVTRELARQAGVVVADTLEDFEDLTKIFCMLRDKNVAGLRLGAISNAGFECVGICDNLGAFELRPFAAKTLANLDGVLIKHRLDKIVEVHNPVDLTPMLNDEGYEEIIRSVLDADEIDIGVVGCVPLTGALNTLQADASHGEDLTVNGSVVRRLVRLKQQLHKPFVVAVDGGSDYDAMVQLLDRSDVPTFGTIDRATRIFEIFCRHKLSHPRR